jgi:hypothetical protein
MSRYGSAGEPLVVPTSALSPILRRWKEIYELEHDFEYRTSEVFLAQDGANVFGPIQYLEFHSGIPRRRIFGIINQEFKNTSLDNAEKLLMAIGKEYMLKNGEVPVVPNPNWKQETWVAYMNKRGCSSDL